MTRILIPHSQAHLKGGPRRFLDNFINGVTESGMTVQFHNLQECDVVLSMISIPICLIRKIAKHHIPMILRLDGAYYRKLHGLRYASSNFRILLSMNAASAIVFQSDYSLRVCKHVFKRIPVPWTVIPNGVNRSIFYPIVRRRFPRNTIFASGFFRYPTNSIRPVILAFRQAQKLISDREIFLRIAGEVPDPEKGLLTHPNVQFLGVLNSIDLADAMKDSDIYLFTVLNPNCSNALLEASATNMPIVCLDSGATREFTCEDSTYYVTMHHNRLVHLPTDFSVQWITKGIEQLLEVSSKSIQPKENPNLISVEEMVSRYQLVIEKVTS